MSKVDKYKDILKNSNNWDEYLLKESGLPGPRANLELLEAVIEIGSEDTFIRYVTEYNCEKAPTNSPEEFLSMCGAAGFGKLISKNNLKFYKSLQSFANDTRWRIRESVAIALQHVGESDIDLLLNEMKVWSKGSLLEKRAVVATLCEPKLLIYEKTAEKVLDILEQITFDILNITDRKTDEFRTLRKALGYGWSVGVVSLPIKGKVLMEKWFLNEDKDIKWIMKENLRKKRLSTMDNEWTIKWKEELGVK